MDKIGIWALTHSDDGGATAQALDEVQSTETEQRLEELLVASPDLLVRGLRLIGRQIQTNGGPLDLLGVDSDGRVVLFELKRGTLTREAVAQLLDYGSDLLERDPEEFAILIQASSGRLGIDRIDDFLEWYQTEFPEVGEPPLDELRMVLVGLGVDDRARRIVNLLARSGLDIQLLTFQAFRKDGEVLLARRVETVEPKHRQTSSGGGKKEDNRRRLTELAREQGVQELLFEVSDFVDDLLPAYRYPHKTTFTFYLNELTEAGRPSQRAYASVNVDQKVQGQVIFTMPDRGIAAAGETVESILSDVPGARMTDSGWTPFELPIRRETWSTIRPRLQRLLEEVVRFYTEKRAEEDRSSAVEPSSSEGSA